MAVQYLASSGAVTTLAAATAKTMVEIATTANLPPEWVTVSCSNMATSGYTIVSFATYTATGTGSIITPRRWGTASGVYDGTVKTNMTVEGAGAADFWTLAFANPFTYERDFPLGREQLQLVSSFMGLRLNSTVAGSATAPGYANLVFEV